MAASLAEWKHKISRVRSRSRMPGWSFTAEYWTETLVAEIAATTLHQLQEIRGIK